MSSPARSDSAESYPETAETRLVLIRPTPTGWRLALSDVVWLGIFWINVPFWGLRQELHLALFGPLTGDLSGVDSHTMRVAKVLAAGLVVVAALLLVAGLLWRGSG